MTQVMDALIEEGTPTSSLGLEIGLRAMVGVVAAQEQDLPLLLDDLEWNPPAGALPKEFMHQSIKRVNRITAAKKKSLDGKDRPSSS